MRLNYIALKPALKESVLRALGRGQELALGDVTRYVTNDYGTVTSRTVSRYLETLVHWDFVKREGVRGHYTYTRVIEKPAERVAFVPYASSERYGGLRVQPL